MHSLSLLRFRSNPFERSVIKVSDWLLRAGTSKRAGVQLDNTKNVAMVTQCCPAQWRPFGIHSFLCLLMAWICKHNGTVRIEKKKHWISFKFRAWINLIEFVYHELYTLAAASCCFFILSASEVTYLTKLEKYSINMCYPLTLYQYQCEIIVKKNIYVCVYVCVCVCVCVCVYIYIYIYIYMFIERDKWKK